MCILKQFLCTRPVKTTVVVVCGVGGWWFGELGTISLPVLFCEGFIMHKMQNVMI